MAGVALKEKSKIESIAQNNHTATARIAPSHAHAYRLTSCCTCARTLPLRIFLSPRKRRRPEGVNRRARAAFWRASGVLQRRANDGMAGETA
jgi:hypothetical protein